MPVRYLRRLELLKPELAEAEDLIDHLLREVVHAVDLGRQIVLYRSSRGSDGAAGGEGASRRCAATTRPEQTAMTAAAKTGTVFYIARKHLTWVMADRTKRWHRATLKFS